MVEAPAFDIAGLPSDQRDLHRRANRVAKVAMQDIKLLRPADVRLGCENKDVCNRLRSDLDKARREYDRRFRAILDHPVDYFHRWMVEILAEGNSRSPWRISVSLARPAALEKSRCGKSPAGRFPSAAIVLVLHAPRRLAERAWSAPYNKSNDA